MLSSQTVFNKSATHLLSQGKQALDKNQNAKYHIGEKTGCALFPFTKIGYNKGRFVEGKNIKSAEVFTMLNNNGVDVDRDWSLLDELQNIHDHYPPQAWPGMLASTASKFGLKMVKTKLKDTSVKVRG